MTSSIFIFSWIFIAIGFLPFYSLHSASISIVFLALWSFVLLSRWVKWQLPVAFRFLLLLSLTAFVWEQNNGIRSVEATAALFAFLGLLKLLESRTKRDGFLFFLIFQLMMVAQYLLLESLWLLGFMLVSSFLMCAMFMDLQRASNKQASFFHAGKRKILFRIMFMSTALAIVLFFVFPRSNFTFFLSRQKEQVHPWTGFSKELRPGLITSVMQDDNLIFRARFSGSAPAMSNMYWNGATLTRSDGFNWQFDPGVRFNNHFEQDAPGIYHFEADMVDSGEGAIFLLSPVANFKLLTRGLLRWRGLGDATFKPLASQKTRWRGALNDQYQHIAETEEQLQFALELDPNIKQWVREEFAELEGKSAAQIVAAINTIFVRDFRYSLSPGAYSGSPLAQLKEFLTVRKVGLCEHFASSMAVILRAFDIPAVIGVGFHGADYNEVGDYWMIRGRDAHAWTMVYDREKGWSRNDPTKFVAPSRINFGATEFTYEMMTTLEQNDAWFEFTRSAWVTQAIKFLDSTYYKLNLSFINYDAEAQREFLASLGLDGWRRSWLKWFSVALGIAFFMAFWLWQRRFIENPWFKVNQLYWSFYKKLQTLDEKTVSTVPPLMLKINLAKKYDAPASAAFIDAYIAIKYGTQNSRPTGKDIALLKRLKKSALKELGKFS